MYDYNEEVGKQLNSLLEKTYDAEKGYQKAAENAKSSPLKNYFQSRSQQRYDFGHELKSELSRFKQEPDKGGSITGNLHRVWMDTKALFSSDNDESMLEESLRGEKASLEEYDEVINSEVHIPESTLNLLKSQRASILNATRDIKTLEDLN